MNFTANLQDFVLFICNLLYTKKKVQYWAFFFSPDWLSLFSVAVGGQGDAVRERLRKSLRDGAQRSDPLRGTGVWPCGMCSQVSECSPVWNVSLQPQKEKAKKFKSQIIKYLESLLQSQQQVSVCPNASLDKNTDMSDFQLTVSLPQNYCPPVQRFLLCFSPADQVLGGFLAWS